VAAPREGGGGSRDTCPVPAVPRQLAGRWEAETASASWLSWARCCRCWGLEDACCFICHRWYSHAKHAARCNGCPVSVWGYTCSCSVAEPRLGLGRSGVIPKPSAILLTKRLDVIKLSGMSERQQPRAKNIAHANDGGAMDPRPPWIRPWRGPSIFLGGPGIVTVPTRLIWHFNPWLCDLLQRGRVWVWGRHTGARRKLMGLCTWTAWMRIYYHVSTLSQVLMLWFRSAGLQHNTLLLIV